MGVMASQACHEWHERVSSARAGSCGILCQDEYGLSRKPNPARRRSETTLERVDGGRKCGRNLVNFTGLWVGYDLILLPLRPCNLINGPSQWTTKLDFFRSSPELECSIGSKLDLAKHGP